MSYEEYKEAYFTNPEPPPRFATAGFDGVSIYFEEYTRAVEFYTGVFGKPAYVEHDEVSGWRIGGGWLSVFAGASGSPTGVEITVRCEDRATVDALRAAFLAAGGSAEEPEEALMYEPVYLCLVSDPFGTAFILTTRVATANG